MFFKDVFYFFSMFCINKTIRVTGNLITILSMVYVTTFISSSSSDIINTDNRSLA